ncbi:SpoIIE family protein phosphatase [Catellatospora aurea]|uniref:SpoIIE family protein phosphatase n=1 Tax=Catellatospora aurea TaxID=1337874 RepID=A0ABW2H5V3_9ACTN
MIDPFEAAGRIRPAYLDVDWAAGPLGPVSSWSPTLIGLVDMLLRTRNAVTLFWGPQFVMVYNAAYADMIGDKHPAALGAPAADVFAEIWDDIGPMLDSVLSGGDATWTEDMKLYMDRHGFTEETYFTFSYSAVRGPDSLIEGIIDIASETTEQVIDRRRLELLGRLTDRIGDAATIPGLIAQALPVLRSVPDDLPDVDIRPGGDTADGRVSLPLTDGLHLVTRLNPHLPDDAGYRGFLRLAAVALVQGLHRAAARRAAATEREMAEALQRSLLSRPAQPDSLDVAVRYHPASRGAQVGGDWYDAFLLPDGTLAVTVGDVTGHDRQAAAAMSQIRNLLRGIAHARPASPDQTLTALDDAMTGLSIDTLTTVVLGYIDLSTNVLRWSNAGHPPPLLINPDGTVDILEEPAELLLGTRTKVPRSQHHLRLAPGTTLILYTDGLIERRDRGLDDGLAVLRAALAGRHQSTAEQLCDDLLASVTDWAEDDIVLLIARRHPH